MRQTKTWVVAGVVASILGVTAAQTPQVPAPTFRSTVDLLTLEASVRDKAGTMVADLQPADFIVTIDGKPRKVVFAHFFKTDASDAIVATGGTPVPRHIASDELPPGRVVVFVIDTQSIRQGQEKSVLETASRMLGALSPSDAVGLVNVVGPSVDITRDRSRITDALKLINGGLPAKASGPTVSYDEAMAFDRNEKNTIAEVIARECRNGGVSFAGAAPSTCPGDVRAEARLVKVREDAHADVLLHAMTSLLQHMSVLRAPRHVILLSGGVPFAPHLVSFYKDLTRAAAEARVVLYTVHLGQINFDAASNSAPGLMAFGDPSIETGLANMASMTGGTNFMASGKATGVFERISSEITTFYELGLESNAADGDGKQHDIDIKISRPGVTVLAPSHLAVAAPSRNAPHDPLDVALQQPTDVADVPMAVTTYSTHGANGAVRLLVSAEIGSPTTAAPAEWGLAVTQGTRGIVNTRGRIPATSQKPRVVSTSVEVPPGTYRLRVAAVDADERIGTMEIPVTAGLRDVDGGHASDLIVGVARAGQVEPRRRIAQSEDLTAMLEVTAIDPSTEFGASLQLVPGGTARPALTVPLTRGAAAAAGGPSVLQGSAPLASLAPGHYTASVILQSGGKGIARLSRLVDIVEGAPVDTPAPGAVSAPAAAGVTALPSVSEDVMHRVGSYIERYGEEASALIATEHYAQSTQSGAGLAPLAPPPTVINRSAAGRPVPQSIQGAGVQKTDRKLVSEFALVRNASSSGGWIGYRDVIEVDGKPVGDRRDRLQTLFQGKTPDLQEARRISAESARYNLGSIKRTFNVPTAALFFFHPASLSRFTFHQRGTERIEGIEALVIEFHEVAKPTLIMTAAGKDVPASGVLWIDPADGSVLRTRLEVWGYAGEATSSAQIDVGYRRDLTLKMWVPLKMIERYDVAGFHVTGQAEYSDFKRFQTSAKISIPK